MSVDRVRHGRQIRLREIGEAGQARLAAHAIVLGGSGVAREIEATYLERAGARVATSPDSDAIRIEAVDTAALGLRHPAAVDVADGALRALAAIRAALERGIA